MTLKEYSDSKQSCRRIWLFWAWFLHTALTIHFSALAQGTTVITNVHQIRLLAAQIPKSSYSIRLEGDVWWARPSDGRFVLKDDSGAEVLEMDLHGQPIAAGQKIRLEGNATVTPAGNFFRLGVVGPVVDNDGVHGMVEKSGAVFLKAGLSPFRVEWFNGVEKYGLKVEYEGPGLPRQPIPDSALFQTPQSNGLIFKSVQSDGELLPDFDSAPALKMGIAKNFDVEMITNHDHLGICYTGFLEVARDGLYTFYTISDDGSRLFINSPNLQIASLGQISFPQPQPLLIGQTLEPGGGQWTEAEGKVTFASDQPHALKLELTADTGCLQVEIADKSSLSAASLLNRRIRATGFAQGVYNAGSRYVPGILFTPSTRNIEFLDRPSATVENPVTTTNTLPLLTTAAEVHRLKREEAERGYPVRIRGVITSVLPEHQAFTLQDSTRGIYIIDSSESRADAPRIGQYLEVEGVSDPGQFAPVIDAAKIRVLGGGNMPAPVSPSWHQLMNGSLDAQYVEIQGILTSVQSNGVVLLTPEGRIQTDIRTANLRPEDFDRYEDALIRVRGCLFANWDYVTHCVKVGEIRMNGAEVSVDQPAPADLFSTPLKTASELLLFDPQASVFQRVRVSGQIIHIRDPEYFMMDGNNGVRIVLKHPSPLQPGDFVDVVGFPELSMGSPILREAVVHPTHHAPPPKARALLPDDLVRPDLDSTLVRIKAVLVDQRNTPLDQVLEARVGLRSFLARLTGKSSSIQNIPPGSQLELTGTYVSQSVNQNVTSFELLLNSPADVVVLARPPWWTLEKLLVILGALACILAGTVLWITQLHREVAQRTVELELQIRERQRAEQQHAMEQERGRIAQDLHDELGSSLTEISMLGVRAQSPSTPPEKRGAYLEQMSDKARQMVTALDEIVWAINPTHNSLGSMVSYFSIYAERFLSLANITLYVDAPAGPEDHVVDSRHRHQLFLAFKEALTNVVRHSEASEVRLSMQIQECRVRLTIADNGRGWSNGPQSEEMDGVINMRTRLKKLGGGFQITSKTGTGTVVSFEMPLHDP